MRDDKLIKVRCCNLIKRESLMATHGVSCREKWRTTARFLRFCPEFQWFHTKIGTTYKAHQLVEFRNFLFHFSLYRILKRIHLASSNYSWASMHLNIKMCIFSLPSFFSRRSFIHLANYYHNCRRFISVEFSNFQWLFVALINADVTLETTWINLFRLMRNHSRGN